MPTANSAAFRLPVSGMTGTESFVPSKSLSVRILIPLQAKERVRREYGNNSIGRDNSLLS